MANDLKSSALLTGGQGTTAAETAPPPSPPAGSPSAPVPASGHAWSQWFVHPPEGSARIVSMPVRVVNTAFAVLLILFLLYLPFTSLRGQWNWAGVYKYRQKFIDGFFLTIGISVAALLLSTVLGVCSALVGRLRFLPLRYCNRVYVDLVRGTPLLVQILILYYVEAPAIGINDRNLAGILILSLSYGAYISEIVRAGIESIGMTQLESAKAIGLTPVQTYSYVIFPQALRQMMPPLAGQLVSLIKDSALLSVIAVGEFTKAAEEVNANTFSTFESYIPLAVGYLLLTLPISFLTRHLEKSTRFDT